MRTPSRRRRRAERRKRRLLWWLWPGLMAGAALVVLAGWFWPQGGPAPLQAAAPPAPDSARPMTTPHPATQALPAPPTAPPTAPPAAPPAAPAPVDPVAAASHSIGLLPYPGSGPLQTEGMAPVEPGLNGSTLALQTTDSAQQVLNFYRLQLGAGGRPADETKGNGDQWLLVEPGVTQGRQRRVLIERDGERTRITVVSLPAGSVP